jgi:hypothetical protein
MRKEADALERVPDMIGRGCWATKGAIGVVEIDVSVEHTGTSKAFFASVGRIKNGG